MSAAETNRAAEMPGATPGTPAITGAHETPGAPSPATTGTAAAPHLVLDDVRFSYGSHEVLRGVSFEARGGQTVCLLGRNGAGKSTLFRCILGLYRSYRGSISLDGREVGRLSQRELGRSLAYIPQSDDPTFDFSVFDVVLMGRTAHLGPGAQPTEADEEAAFASLERLGISDLAGSGYAHISGGERQMVLIARALAQQAGVLVMDEPTANLDYGNQYRVMEQVEALRAAGYLVVLSTHNPQQALSYGTDVLVLDEGRVVVQGPPQECLTEQVMSELYGIPVSLYRVPNKRDPGTERTLCAQG